MLLEKLDLSRVSVIVFEFSFSLRMFDELLQDFFMLFLFFEGSADHVDEDDEDSNDGGETCKSVIFC